MRKSMKKALSLILIVAMLLSLALTATVATSAEDSNTKFNSYFEFYNPSGSSIYQGILVDGVKKGGAEVDSNGTSPNFLHTAIEENKVYLGVSHSSAQPGYTGVNPNEVHMNVLVTDGSTITDIFFTTSGNDYYINPNYSSAWLWKTTNTDQSPYDSSVGEFKKVNDTYYEWRIALKQLRLEKVYAETALSTDFSITVKTSSGTYTKSGRLVLNDTLHPSHAWYNTHFAKKDISSLSIASYSGFTIASHDVATKTTTMTATVDGKRNALAHYSANQTWTWQMVSQMAWEYNMDLTVSKMPDIGSDALVLSCNAAIAATTTPSLMFYLNDTNVNNNSRTKGVAIGIFNRNNQLYIASTMDTTNAPSNEVALGVAPSDTSFKLRIAWTLDGNYTVFVNDVKMGTVISGKGGMHFGSARFLTVAELHGGSNYNGGEQSVKIQNFTVEHSSYGVADTLLAASATPNYVPAIKYYQTSPVVGEGEDATYNVRLVATVDKALVDSGLMTATGFNIQASKTTADGTVNGALKTHKVYTVYSRITADGLDVSAPDGTYFLVFTITGIHAADLLTLNFSAFAETADTSYVEGSVFTLTFQNGERKSR